VLILAVTIYRGSRRKAMTLLNTEEVDYDVSK
jgi:hypothetical protein